jgi:plastocyanin
MRRLHAPWVSWGHTRLHRGSVRVAVRTSVLTALVVLATIPGAGAATSTVIETENNTFWSWAEYSSTIHVNVGDTVTWENHDTHYHDVTADDGSWRSGKMAPSATYSHTFTAPGVYSYSCTLHQVDKMVGTVVVGVPTNPAYAVRLPSIAQ